MRAQISRIVHSTTLLPKGQWKITEDEGSREIEPEEPPEGQDELSMPTTSAMSKADMWVHANVNILKNCRTTHPEPEEPEGAEDFDPDEAKKEMEAADPYEPRLKPITTDSKVRFSQTLVQPAWVVRLYGDATEYVDEKTKKKDCTGVVAVRSLLWPGAYSFYQGERILQVYCGNGHKYEHEQSYFPVHPPPVIADPDEYEDQPEPTPLEAPVEQENEGEPGEEGEEEGSQEEDD